MTLYDICKYAFNFENDFNSLLLTCKRKEHSLSVYHIGKYIYSKLNSQLLISTKYDGKILSSFELIWKYLSMYHDIGYDHQDIYKYNYNKIETEYSCEILDINEKQNNLWLKELKFNDLMAYYFLNCIEPYDVKEPCEHGILGSYIFHKMYYKNPPLEYHNLKSWDYIVLAISLTMAQHNIWPVTKEKIERLNIDLDNFQCTKKSNGEYVLYQHEQFSYTNSFLPFYLCLIDTIEPLKLFYNKSDNLLDTVKSKLFLKSIEINIVTNNNLKYISLKVLDDNVKYITDENNKSIYDKWVKNIINAGNFLKVKTITSKEEIRINIL